MEGEGESEGGGRGGEECAEFTNPLTDRKELYKGLQGIHGLD